MIGSERGQTPAYTEMVKTFHIVLLLTIFCSVRAGASGTNVLGSVAEMRNLSNATCAEGHPFHLEGTVFFALPNGHYLIRDTTGNLNFHDLSDARPCVGATVRIDGVTRVDEYRQRQFAALSVLVTGTNRVAKAVEASVERILFGKHNYQVVSVTGFVLNTFRDDSESRGTLLVLKQNSHLVVVKIPLPGGVPFNANGLRHAHVRITGAVLPDHVNERCYIGPHLETTGPDAIELLSKAPSTPFNVTPLRDFTQLYPAAIVTEGPHTAVGRVLAVWGGRNLLIRTEHGDLHKVELLEDEDPPACLSMVRISGHPATDTYQINFLRAHCQTLAAPEPVREDIRRTDPAMIFRDRHGTSHVNRDFHGQAVRLVGSVLAKPDETGRALIDCAGFRLAYDISATPGLADRLVPGSRVEIAGVGLVETDSWHADNILPAVRGFVVIARSPNDVTVIASAPWWTPRRTLIAFVSFVAILVGLLVWIQLLRQLVERRGRQLYRKEFERSAAELRTEDRTRLAVELHDSLSQTLTGVALQIDAIAMAAEQDPSRVADYVNNARRTVDNCRNELKNCLWDLRNQSLDDSDAAEALRKTVSPQAGDATVTIDFAIPRSHFTDLTFHDVLRIVRELVTNAVRHGKARNIVLSGTDDGRTVRVSVRDDGRGFDPSARPGIAEGHFGLDGIAERLRRTHGTLAVDSAPGRGTTVTFTLSKGNNP